MRAIFAEVGQITHAQKNMKSIDARTAKEREIIAWAEEHEPDIVTPPTDDVVLNTGLLVRSHTVPAAIEKPAVLVVKE